jgi:hypothetical protein
LPADQKAAEHEEDEYRFLPEPSEQVESSGDDRMLFRRQRAEWNEKVRTRVFQHHQDRRACPQNIE